MGDVIDIDPGPKAHACPVCGGTWWLTDAITVDQDGSATGYALPLRCRQCTLGGDLVDVNVLSGTGKTVRTLQEPRRRE